MAKTIPQKTAQKVQQKKANSNSQTFIFDKENYKWMFIGLAIIIFGFILMYGKEDIFDTRKIIIAPIVILGGFIFEIFAIMKKPNSNKEV